MILIAFIFSFTYLVLITWFFRGWLKTGRGDELKNDPVTRFSIIVPARNEQDYIANTITELANQNYPGDYFEIIIVDDDSSDQTYNTAEKTIEEIDLSKISIQLLHLAETENIGSGHKKRAITYGIGKSKFEWIITTDADCHRGPNWLKSIAASVEKHMPVLVSAPVMFFEEKGLFQKMQSLEFMSLVGMGASSIANNMPNMCNGANLAYKKSVFYEVGEFDDNVKLSSGDDEFLMHKIALAYPGKVRFQKSRDAIVSTHAHRKISEFIQQRKRWVSKSTRYKRKDIQAILIFVYSFHVFILLAGIGSILFSSLFFPFLIMFFGKLLFECILVVPFARYFGKSALLPYYPLAALFYVIYVSAIGIAGNSGSYTWKGRRVK